MKVLQVVTLSEMGGAQKVVYHLASGLDARLFEVTVACAPGGELVRWLKKPENGEMGRADGREGWNAPAGKMEGSPGFAPAVESSRPSRVVELPELKRNIAPFYDLLALRRLYRLIRQERFDVVHCHSSKAGILGRLAAWLAGVPKIYFTVHGWGITEYQRWPVRLFYTWAERLAGAVSTKVVCVSESDMAKGRDLRLVASDKLSVIYNGVPEPKKQKGALRGELNIKEEDIIIGTVARLAPQKDPLFLLEAAGRMINHSGSGPGEGRLYFVLIGDGPLRSKCEEFIHSKGLNGRVFILGAREEAAELVQDFDVFVLFSRWEGLPLTIIEAMLAGVPVVANAVGGVGELVAHQKTGYLINKRDVNEAAEALWDLVVNPDKRLSMGELGKQRAADLFSINEMVERYRKLYLS